MKWVSPLFVLYFLSCEIFDNKKTATSDLDNNLLTTVSDREITVNAEMANNMGGIIWPNNHLSINAIEYQGVTIL